MPTQLRHYIGGKSVHGSSARSGEVFDPATAAVFGLREGEVVVSIHCGSRALGHQVATEYAQLMLKAAGITARTFESVESLRSNSIWRRMALVTHPAEAGQDSATLSRFAPRGISM